MTSSDVVVLDDKPASRRVSEAAQDTAVSDPKPKTEEIAVDEEGGSVDDYENRVTVNADGSKTYTLLHPFKQRFRKPGGEEYEKEITSLTFRRFNGGDLSATASFTNEEQRGIQLFLRMAGISETVFEKIDGDDLDAAFQVQASFLSRIQKTGKKSSRK